MSARGSGKTFRKRFSIVPLALAAIAVLLATASSASATIVLTEGTNTVSTPKFEWNFGDCGGANVEKVDSVRWLPSGGTELGPNLAANNAGGNCPTPTEFWGQSYGNEDSKGPGPVVQCNAGTWTPRGSRSVELNSVGASTGCTGDNPPIPMRTRYTFFDGGAHADMVRIERRWSFAAGQTSTNPAQGMRTYVPRLSVGTYNQEIYPNSSDALVTAGVGESIVLGSSWSASHQWVAINASSTNAGILILRDQPSTGASIRIDYDGSSGSNNTGITLDRPVGGWLAPVTETEFLCFYDATTWPVASREADVLPSGCAPVNPPINTAAPTVSAGAGDPQPGDVFTATPGAWENSTGNFAFQWSRCLGESCDPIGGANGTTYTATGADVSRSLKITITATAPGGETDSASSNNAGTISGTVYAGSVAPANKAANARVQACKVGGGSCRSTTADLQGAYLLQVPVSGDYEVSAFPGAGSNALPRPRAGVTAVKDEADTPGQDVVLGVTGPPPPQVGFSGAGYRGNSGAGGVPVVHWQEPFVIEYKAPIGSEVEVEVEFPGGPPESFPPSGPPEPSPKDPEEGIFKFPVPPLYPNHGPAEIKIKVKPKPPTGPEESTFPIYIDPSGLVRTTTGEPLAGATVTLYRSESKAGPFEVVPDGSATMSPMNRTNPDLTEADGHFGWDVVAGFYKVRAAKSGCNAPGDRATAFVETGVMTIPPPVTNLDIALECPAPFVAGPVPILATLQPPIVPPKTTAPKKLKCKKGFVKKKVKGKTRCVRHPKKKKKKR